MATRNTNADSSPAGELGEFIEYLAKNLVEDPEHIQVDVEQDGQVVRIHLSVPEEEMGKVIGREGRIARSMRTLLMIAASRRGLRSSLDIGQ